MHKCSSVFSCPRARAVRVNIGGPLPSLSMRENTEAHLSGRASPALDFIWRQTKQTSELGPPLGNPFSESNNQPDASRLVPGPFPCVRHT